MGTIRVIPRSDAGFDELLDHEGHLEFFDEATSRWESAWGHQALGSPGHRASMVRATCACGWDGPISPWGHGHPDETTETELMGPWDVHVDAFLATFA